MKELLTIILILGICNLGISKGSRGIYYLKGIAYQYKLKPIRNKIIELEYGDYKEKVKTNSKGEFIVKIIWEYPCMSAGFHEITKEYEELVIRRANPKYIMFKYKERCIYVENFFYKNDSTDFNFSNTLSFNQDLKF